jgi:hypothetical protein
MRYILLWLIGVPLPILLLSVLQVNPVTFARLSRGG